MIAARDRIVKSISAMVSCLHVLGMRWNKLLSESTVSLLGCLSIPYCAGRILDILLLGGKSLLRC
jgi:hypothetical protein